MSHIIFLNGIWPNSTTGVRTHFTRSISCYQLKHWISHFGFRSRVIDYCQHLSDLQMVELIDKFSSKETIAIGLSTTFWPMNSVPPEMLSVIEMIRSKYPSIKIIGGGARKSHHINLFDEYFVGESEDKLVTWCQEQIGKKGLSAFNKKFSIVDLVHRFDETDAILDSEALPIELGRGCVFKCKFCAHHNLGKPKYTYQRNHSAIVDEIVYNKEKFNTSKYMFLDDTVNEDLDKIRNLSTIKESTGIDIEWTGYLRADLVWSKQESADLLFKSGMKSCFFGIETFNPVAGKSIDKGWASKHGKEYLPKLYNNIWDKNVNIHLNLIAGLPGETIDSLSDSLGWCIEHHQIGSHRFVPLTLYVEKDDENASSEFTKNHSKYGYKNVDNTGYWENKFLNSTEAIKFCENSNRQLAKTNKISSWSLFNVTNLGFSTNEVMKWNESRIMWAAVVQKRIFIAKYLDKLRNINQ